MGSRPFVHLDKAREVEKRDVPDQLPRISRHDGKLRYVGLMALYNPPREDSAETIANAQSIGVDVKMVTGDHVAIAREVLPLVGLRTNIVTAPVIEKPDVEAESIAERATGSRRSSPSTSAA